MYTIPTPALGTVWTGMKRYFVSSHYYRNGPDISVRRGVLILIIPESMFTYVWENVESFELSAVHT